MASSNDVRKKISQLHQELVNACKKRFMCENGHAAVVKCSPIWKNGRKDFKTFPELKSQVHSQKKHGNRKLSLVRLVKASFYLYGKTVPESGTFVLDGIVPV